MSLRDSAEMFRGSRANKESGIPIGHSVEILRIKIHERIPNKGRKKMKWEKRCVKSACLIRPLGIRVHGRLFFSSAREG